MCRKGGNIVIDINKNIDNYKETVVLGLTVSAYIAISVVTPIALSGFYSYNGMGFIEMMKLKMHFAFGNRALAYVSTEGEDVIRNIRQQEMMADKKAKKKQRDSQKIADNGEDFRKEAKKMLFIMFLMLVILGTLAGAAVWYKYFK